MEASQI